MLFVQVTLVFALSLHDRTEAKTKFTQMKESCDFNFKNEKLEATKGNRYVNSEAGIFVCCAPQIKQESLQLDTSHREINCCVERDTVKVGGLRPCAGKMIFTKFKGNSKEVIETDPGGILPLQHGGSSTKCSFDQQVESEATSFLRQSAGYRLIPIAQKECKDPKKPWRIKWIGVAPGYKKYAYSWCCSQDIYSDYTLDPKKLCCGLSGAESNYYTKGALVMPDNPPCCRHHLKNSDMSPPCEPYIMNNAAKTSPYRTCPPVSGIYDITPNLDEEIPENGPWTYALPDKVSTSDDLYTQSTCVNNTNNKEYKYFYSSKNVYDRVTLVEYGGVSTRRSYSPYGFCCKQPNTFALDAKTIGHSCCSVTTTKITKFDEQSLILVYCYNKRNKVKYSGWFKFPACELEACLGDDDKFLSLAEKNAKYRIEYSVKKDTGKNLYGSEIFFASKNTKLTGPVNLS